MQNGVRPQVPVVQNDGRQEAQGTGRRLVVHMENSTREVLGAVIEERNTVHGPHRPEITVNLKAKPLVKHILGQFDNIHEFQQNGTFCDITIKVGGTSFKAHKLVLASTCEYFHAMFTSGFQESRDAEVSITGTPDAFKILLDFLYTGVLDVNHETTTDVITDVLKMAHYLQLAGVVSGCENLLVRGFPQFSLTEVLQMMSLCDMFELQLLKNRCRKFLAKNFDGSDDFLRLMTHQLILETMDHPSFSVMEEKKVFDVVIAWLKHDWEARKEFAAQLFQKLRLGVVPPGHMTVTFLKTPELNSIPECQQMVVRVMELFDSKTPSDPPLAVSNPDLFETRSTVTAMVDILQNGIPKFFDTKEDQIWRPLPRLPKVINGNSYVSIKNSSCVVANDQLYVARRRSHVPGQIPQLVTDLLVLDEVNQTWKSLAPMTQIRRRCCLVPHYDNHIYAIGGVALRDDESQKKCEVYIINENRWREIAPMPLGLPVVNSSTAVSYNGKIIVMGETKVDDSNSRSVVMMYDPVRDAWFILKQSNVRASIVNAISKSPSGLITQNGKCYYVGPSQLNTRTNTWGSINICEFEVNVQDKRCSTKEKQSQDDIPEQLRKHMVCVDQVLYGYCGSGFHKLDVSVESIKNEKQHWVVNMGLDACVTTYKFDKALYM